MNKEYILEQIETIKATADDNELAHSIEASLREDFITYIAERNDHLGEKARLILTTNKINFARLCA